MTTEHIPIHIEGPIPFYSPLDEEHFFSWLNDIPAIETVRGIGTGLELTVRTPIDRTSLYNLIAAMRRYGLNLAVLRPLCDQHSDGYFQDSEKYWHASIYGSAQK